MASSGSDATGSAGAYSECAVPTRSSAATADCPWRPIARTADRRFVERGERDVVGIRERLLVAVHGANADAAVDENEPALTMPSSRLQLSIREYWK